MKPRKYVNFCWVSIVMYIKYIVYQDLTKCSPKGRDCVERNSARSFNCNTTCEGIYAGVEWEEEIMHSKEENELGVENKAMTELYKGMYERIKEDLKKEMRLTKGQKGEKDCLPAFQVQFCIKPNPFW